MLKSTKFILKEVGNDQLILEPHIFKETIPWVAFGRAATNTTCLGTDAREGEYARVPLLVPAVSRGKPNTSVDHTTRLAGKP